MRTMIMPSIPVPSNNMSQGSRRASTLQSFGIRKKSEIDIVLDGKDEFVRSYSTFDEIKGHVNLRFDKDTPVESLNISFQGQANTWVEKMTSVSPRTGRATARHIFLRMQQPIDGNPFSEDNIAEAGTTYSIPFNFVVPEKVLPFVCSHQVSNNGVKAHHHYLPPSIGESMLAGQGSLLMDDLCPAMAKIVYSVKVNIVKAGAKTRAQEAMSHSIGVRIIPARAELPPELDSPAREGCLKYAFRKEKNVRKGLLKLGKKQGRLTAETTQPRCLKLARPGDETQEAPSTIATINLRYDPASSDETPPQLTSVDSRLKAYTFFGAAPFRTLIDPTNYDIWSVMHSEYALKVDLSSMNLSAVKWTKHDAEGPFAERIRHGSVATTASSNKAQNRKMSTSTGTASSDEPVGFSELHRSPSNLSRLSDASYSPASSATTLSTPASPTMTNSKVSFADKIVSPSEKYDQTLPFYTASITVPITLPSVQSGSSDTPTNTGSRRSSTAVPEYSAVDPSSRRGSVDPSANAATSTQTTTFSRKRGIPTFLPTFHSCLIARTYVLELAMHAANPAPQINLRTPIQIASELPATQMQDPTNGVPMSWYDPFDLSNETSSLDAEGTANDEAIARALGSQSRTAPSGPDVDQIPLYADLQIQTRNVASYTNHQFDDDTNDTIPAYAQRRHNSAPLSSLRFSSDDYISPPADELTRSSISSPTADLPPEYNAPVGFRRQQSTPSTRVQPGTNGGTDRASSNGSCTGQQQQQNQRRRQSAGWTKRLGLRT